MSNELITARDSNQRGVDLVVGQQAPAGRPWFGFDALGSRGLPGGMALAGEQLPDYLQSGVEDYFARWGESARELHEAGDPRADNGLNRWAVGVDEYFRRPDENGETLRDRRRARMERLRPGPSDSHSAEILNMLGNVFTLAGVGIATGGVAGGAAGIGLITGEDSYRRLTAEGVEPELAQWGAAFEGSTMALGALLPASLGWRSLVARAVTGAGMNAGFGVATRAGMHEMLREDYPELAAQYQAFEMRGLLIDAILGAGFGALHPRASGAPHEGAVLGDPLEQPDGTRRAANAGGQASAGDWLRTARALGERGQLVEAYAHAQIAAARGDRNAVEYVRQLEEQGVTGETAARAQNLAAELAMRGDYRPHPKLRAAALHQLNLIARDFVTLPGVPATPHMERTAQAMRSMAEDQARHDEDIGVQQIFEEAIALRSPAPAEATLADFVRRQGEQRDANNRIIKRGGVADDRGDVAGDASDGKRGFASLIAPAGGGRQIDEIIENAVADGWYFPDVAMDELPTRTQFLEALSAEADGNPIAELVDEGAAARAYERRMREQEFDERGIDLSLPDDALRAQIREVYAPNRFIQWPEPSEADAQILRDAAREAGGDEAMAAWDEALKRAEENQTPIDPEDMYFAQERAIDQNGFVSIALEAAHALPSRAMTGAEAVNRIAKARGVEGFTGRVADEITHLGLREEFAARQSVTRAEVIQYIEGRRLVLGRHLNVFDPKRVKRPTKREFLARHSGNTLLSNLGIGTRSTGSSDNPTILFDTPFEPKRQIFIDSYPDRFEVRAGTLVEFETLATFPHEARAGDISAVSPAGFVEPVSVYMARDAAMEAAVRALVDENIHKAVRLVADEDINQFHAERIDRAQLEAGVRRGPGDIRLPGQDPVFELRFTLPKFLPADAARYAELEARYDALHQSMVESGSDGAAERSELEALGREMLDMEDRAIPGHDFEGHWSREPSNNRGVIVSGRGEYRTAIVDGEEMSTVFGAEVQSDLAQARFEEDGGPATRADNEEMLAYYQRELADLQRIDRESRDKYPNDEYARAYTERRMIEVEVRIKEVEADLNPLAAQAALKAELAGVRAELAAMDAADAQASAGRGEFDQVPFDDAGSQRRADLNTRVIEIEARQDALRIRMRGGDIPPLSAKTSQWTGVGVRGLAIQAARMNADSVSFPTGETSHLIQGNDDASVHYDTNVLGALNRLARALGGEVKKAAVRYHPEDIADWVDLEPEMAHSILDTMWAGLPASARVAIRRNLPLIRGQRRSGRNAPLAFVIKPDRDPFLSLDAGNIEETGVGASTIEWAIKSNRGNPLRAAYEVWVQGAMLWNDAPGTFNRLLEKAAGGEVGADQAFRDAVGRGQNADAYVLPLTPAMKAQLLEGIPMFAQQQARPGFNTVANLRAEAMQAFGIDRADGVVALEEAGGMEFVETKGDIPVENLGGHPRGLQAVHIKSMQRTYFVAGNIRPGLIKGRMIHEIGVHQGMVGLIGKGGLETLLRQVDRLVAADHPMASLARAHAEAHSAHPSHVREETLAWLVTWGADLPAVNTVMARVRRGLVRLTGFDFGLKLDVADMRDLALSALFRQMELAKRARARGPSIVETVRVDPRMAEDAIAPNGLRSARTMAPAEAQAWRNSNARVVRESAKVTREHFRSADGAPEDSSVEFTALDDGGVLVGVEYKERHARAAGEETSPAHVRKGQELFSRALVLLRARIHETQPRHLEFEGPKGSKAHEKFYTALMHMLAGESGYRTFRREHWMIDADGTIKARYETFYIMRGDVAGEFARLGQTRERVKELDDGTIRESEPPKEFAETRSLRGNGSARADGGGGRDGADRAGSRGSGARYGDAGEIKFAEVDPEGAGARALRDDPDMMLRDELGREQSARLMVDAAEAEKAKVRELEPGIEAAARCAGRAGSTYHKPYRGNQLQRREPAMAADYRVGGPRGPHAAGLGEMVVGNLLGFTAGGMGVAYVQMESGREERRAEFEAMEVERQAQAARYREAAVRAERRRAFTDAARERDPSLAPVRMQAPDRDRYGLEQQIVPESERPEIVAFAAAFSGVDPTYLSAMIEHESRWDALNTPWDPARGKNTSSAVGLGQFLNDTWDGMQSYFPTAEGLSRAQWRERRRDPAWNAAASGVLAVENARALQASLGRAPTNAEVYLYHMLGAQDASKLIRARDMGATNAARILPEAALANESVFYEDGDHSRPRSPEAVIRRQSAIFFDESGRSPVFRMREPAGR